MRNITVTVDEETHRRARIRAAELDTSVSALVREFLRRIAPRHQRHERAEGQPLESALERRRRLFDEVFADFDARGVGLRMADNLPRSALHDRSATRATRPGRLSDDDAVRFLEPVLEMRVQAVTLGVFRDAVAMRRRFGLHIGMRPYSPRPGRLAATPSTPRT